MKRLVLLCISFIMLLPAYAQNLLNDPESVVYDAQYDRYLVSNCGDGCIVQIDQAGNQSYFNTELIVAVGLHIVGDTIFVSSNGGPYTGIVGLLLETGEIVFHVQIPEKEFLNDITSDNSGYLYVTDNDANKIFKVSISDMTYITLVGDGLAYPNGILFDEQNERLLVLNCFLPGKPILSISMDGQSVSTIVETGISSIDGLTEDNYGNYYFSSWATNRVYQYDPLFTNPPEIVASGLIDPADIFYNKLDQVLAIPCFNADTLILLPHNPVVMEEDKPIITELIEAYPNPFTNRLTICSKLLGEDGTDLYVYDMLGQQRFISNPDRILKSENSIDVDAGNFEPGIYVVVIRKGSRKEVCKVLKQ